MPGIVKNNIFWENRFKKSLQRNKGNLQTNPQAKKEKAFKYGSKKDS